MAVQTSSSTTNKLLVDLGVDKLSQQLESLHLDQASFSRSAQNLSVLYRGYKAQMEERKNEIIVQVSADNADQSESKIERLLKLAIAGDETYNGLASEALEAQNELTRHESSLRLVESQIRSLQARMSTVAAAMHVSAADRRAKTAATLLGAQASAIAAGNL